MFAILTYKSGRIEYYESAETLSTYTVDKTAENGIIIVVDGKPGELIPLAEFGRLEQYPTRAAALLDGADLRDYPALK